ncbi:MAG: hypothetical protein RIQ60_3098 [Pseudomonadota bacterium]|jgi:hypothetical protein
MYSMFHDEQASSALTPPDLTLRVYRGLAALAGTGALAVWTGGWGESVPHMVVNALWVGLGGWMGALIFCETMIVGAIVAQSLHLARRELDGHQPFGVPSGLLPDFCDLRALRQLPRAPAQWYSLD